MTRCSRSASTRGWDAAKKVNGRKRHIAVDATGLLPAVVITAASVQDRDAARPLLWNLVRGCRHIRLIWADSGYQAARLLAWATRLHLALQIVRRPDGLHTFQVLPRRWVVERTFAWISKHRRTVRDYERLPASHEAMVTWAMIALMARRLAQPAHLSNTRLVRSEDIAQAAELVGDAAGVDAVLREHPSVLGVASVDLVGELAAGLAGLVVVALAAQQLQDLVLIDIHLWSPVRPSVPERPAATLAALARQGHASASFRHYAD
jgi:transposase